MTTGRGVKTVLWRKFCGSYKTALFFNLCVNTSL